jgi:hypothetical protein
MSEPIRLRKRVHTVRCGMAKRPKCVCVCGGARHQELLKKTEEPIQLAAIDPSRKDLGEPQVAIVEN